MQKSLTDNVISSLKFGVSYRLIYQLFSWAATIYIIRVLTPYDYSIMSLMDITFSVTLMIAHLGLSAAIIKNKSINENELASIFTLLLLLHFGLIAIIISFRHHISLFFNSSELSDVLLATSCILIINPFLIIYEASLARDMQYIKIEKIRFYARLSTILINVILVTIGLGYWALVISFISGRYIKYFLYLFSKQSSINFRLHFDFKPITTIFSDSFINYLASVIWEVNDRIDRFFIAKFLNASALGIYSVSYMLTQKPINLTGEFIGKIGLSSFAEYQNDKAKISRLFIRASMISALIMCPVFFGIASISNDLIPLLLGEKWINAIPIIQILSILQLLIIFKFIVDPALFSLGYTKHKLKQSLAALIILTIAWRIGVETDLTTATLSFLAGYTVWFIYLIWETKSLMQFQIKDYLKAVGIPFFLSTIMAIAIYSIGSIINNDLPIIIKLIIQIATGIVIYHLGLILLFKKPYYETLKLLGLK